MTACSLFCSLVLLLRVEVVGKFVKNCWISLIAIPCFEKKIKIISLEKFYDLSFINVAAQMAGKEMQKLNGEFKKNLGQHFFLVVLTYFLKGSFFLSFFGPKLFFWEGPTKFDVPKKIGEGSQKKLFGESTFFFRR